MLVATYRPLGAVLPLRGLRNQRFEDFNVILVTEIGPAAWGGKDELVKDVKVIEVPALNFHCPTRAFNRGLDGVKSPVVALLADFAYPTQGWLQSLVHNLQAHEAAFVGGVKCSHGTADVWTAGNNARCEDKPLIPLGLVPELSVSYPCQGGFTLGNAAFRRADAEALNGFEERFAGDHGFEDENFVRRIIAHTKKNALIDKRAVIHHYWPYSSGYKPLLKPAARPWAFGIHSAQFDRLLAEGENLLGILKAGRVPNLADAAPEALMPRVPSPAPPFES